MKGITCNHYSFACSIPSHHPHGSYIGLDRTYSLQPVWRSLLLSSVFVLGLFELLDLSELVNRVDALVLVVDDSLEHESFVLLCLHDLDLDGCCGDRVFRGAGIRVVQFEAVMEFMT